MIFIVATGVQGEGTSNKTVTLNREEAQAAFEAEKSDPHYGYGDLVMLQVWAPGEEGKLVLDREASETYVFEGDDNNEEYFDESMDGDAESALASAGFGTDEDYGGFDGCDDF